MAFAEYVRHMAFIWLVERHTCDVVGVTLSVEGHTGTAFPAGGRRVGRLAERAAFRAAFLASESAVPLQAISLCYQAADAHATTGAICVEVCHRDGTALDLTYPYTLDADGPPIWAEPHVALGSLARVW